MEEKTGQQQQTPAPEKGMNDFHKALLWTAIPILILSAISFGGSIADPDTLVFGVGFGAFGGVAAGLWGLAILVCIGFALARKRQTALGILAGIGIGIVGLGASCFAYMGNI